jgi:hypothetical protein
VRAPRLPLPPEFKAAAIDNRKRRIAKPKAAGLGGLKDQDAMVEHAMPPPAGNVLKRAVRHTGKT